MRTLKPNLLSMDAYVVPQDADMVKLNQNESPEDMPRTMKQQILERMQTVNWNRYPAGDAGSLIEAIAAYTNFPATGIMVGNGSNEVIQTLIHGTCDSHHTIVTVQPGFSVYKRVAEVMNVSVVEVPLGHGFSFDVQALIEAGQKARIMFLAIPNNPTGTTLDANEIRHIAGNVPCIVAIDEAYYEFSGQSAQPLVGELDNIVILRTFSKALRMAGLRLGYMLGPEFLIKEFKKARLPFSVGLFQQVAGEVILKNRSLWFDSAAQTIQEKNRVLAALEKIEGIRAIPSHANFILFETQKIQAEDMFAELRAKGVLLRYFGRGRLENMLRVTIGTPEENEIFLLAIEDVVGRRRDESVPL